MISIEKVKNEIKCCQCDEKASKVVDGDAYCSKCCDTLLIATIGMCMKNVEHATVKMMMMPKGVIHEEQKEKHLKGGTNER